MNSLLKCIILLTLSVITSVSHAGGFSLSTNRVVYYEKDKQATLKVMNTAEKSVFLAQSWVSLFEGNSSAPFVVTPPLYRQAFGNNIIKIVRTSNIERKDRESVYWLNVKAIPGGSESFNKGSKLQFAYVIRIKLFYRPEGLSGDPLTNFEKASFSRKGNLLTVYNPTPYYITFSEVYVGGKKVIDITPMVPPFGSQSYVVPEGAVGDVNYKVITDIGGVTTERKVEL